MRKENQAVVGIIGAMNEEIVKLHQEISEQTEVREAGLVFYKGELRGKSVVYCKSGIGKVNAAVCTQLLIKMGVTHILFTGVAGALDPTLAIGDIVVSSSCVHHDMDCRPLGYDRGVIPNQEVSDFQADHHLKLLAVDAAERLFPGSYKLGTILSGDQFVASRSQVQDLHESMQGLCVEMEGAAVAQVCTMFAIPFVIIRSISDKADGSAPSHFADFTLSAAGNSFLMIKDILSHL